MFWFLVKCHSFWDMREKGMKEGENCSAQFVGLVSSDPQLPTEPSGVQSSHFSAREKEMISGG